MELLRDHLLAGQAIAARGPLREPISAALVGLGARVEAAPEDLDDEGAAAWADAKAPLQAIVYDAAAAFGGGGRDGLLAAVEHGWAAIRAVAASALIPAGAGGRVVVIAPAADATKIHVEAARAGLENMARTLSVEWARHSITATTIAPGPSADEAQLASLVGFLLSPAGGYFSGCRFDLGAI